MPDSFPTLLKVVGVLIPLAALFIGFLRAWGTLYPLWRDISNRKLLEKKLNLGPFDVATIRRATRFYVRPHFTNIDPSYEIEYRAVLAAARDDLFSTVERWLANPGSRRHLLLLADSGIGKSSFLLNYFAHNENLPRRKRLKISLIALGQKDADRQIEAIPDKTERVVFLDALDEDVRAIANHRRRLSDLMNACSAFQAVILTCRTQFFLRDEEIPRDVGVIRVGPREAAESGGFEFWKLYLAPFDDEDVEKYIRRRYPLTALRRRKQVRELVRMAPNLSLRPMLLAHLPDILESGHRIEWSHELYEVMVSAWLHREKGWVDPVALERFSQSLAIDLYINREKRGAEAVPSKELATKARQMGLPELSLWQLTGRSLLNRDADGNYKFSHRSMLEYLTFKGWRHGAIVPTGTELTDLMSLFVLETMIDHTRAILDQTAWRHIRRSTMTTGDIDRWTVFAIANYALSIMEGSEDISEDMTINSSPFSLIHVPGGNYRVFAGRAKLLLLRELRNVRDIIHSKDPELRKIIVYRRPNASYENRLSKLSVAAATAILQCPRSGEPW